MWCLKYIENVLPTHIYQSNLMLEPMKVLMPSTTDVLWAIYLPLQQRQMKASDTSEGEHTMGLVVFEQ